MIRKAGFAFLLLGVVTVAAGFYGKRLPKSFLPDEDQGYLYAGLQLPDASSLQRSSEAAREVGKDHHGDPRRAVRQLGHGLQHVERRQRYL